MEAYAPKRYHSPTRNLRLVQEGTHARTDIPDVDRRHLRAETEVAGTQALPAGVDAGTIVSVQPGLRGLWEDPVPRPYPEEEPDAGAVFPGGGGMRRPDGEHS